jgi:oxazoline/thiazoline synthase
MEADAAARPRFKASLEPIIDADDGLFVFSDGWYAWLPEPVFSALAPLLDGAHEIEEIFDRLTDGYPAELVFRALDHLRTCGYLADDTAAEARPWSAFCEHAGVAPSLARSRLNLARVSTMAFGAVGADLLTELLAHNGITVVPDGDCTIVVTDNYLRPEIANWNSRSLASGKAWLLVKPVGLETWLGPTFVPGQTACWECLAQRLRGHRRVQRYLAERTGTDVPVGAPSASMFSAQHSALADAATEITRWIATGGQSVLLDRVVSTNVLTLARVHHTLNRRPHCPACGCPAEIDGMRPRPVRLRDRPRVHTSAGDDRSGPSREVIERLERHLSPITGIVSTLTRGERTDAAHLEEPSVTPTVAADHHFSDVYDERFFLREAMRRRSGGRGKTPEQARASALFESLERYSGVFDGTEPRITSTFVDLGPAAIHPNACMHYSERQYAERESHNRRGHKAYWVPEPFCETAAIEWTPLWSLTTEQTRYLPTSYCYFGYQSLHPVFARADSNGCAAGAVLEEAVLQGLLELIERDAVAIWWYNRLRRPAVDLDSADDPYVSALMRHYVGLRRELWVLDITSDFGVPVFAAVSRRVNTVEEDIIYGFGAHLDARVALTRALTELNQSLESVPAASGPASARRYRGSGETVHWWRTVRLADADYLSPDIGARSRCLQAFTSLASDDLHQDVRTCCKLAAKRGIDVLVLDQTRPDVGLPVVRVVAPGLRHFWARWGPGRLYDVPVREGWLARSLEESELNPFVVHF